MPCRAAEEATPAEAISLFLCGDVMTGRGIDQVLPHPGKPALHEPYLEDARRYLRLAESVNGPIPQPVDFDYIWGDALEVLERAATDVKIINLETSITCSDCYWPYKAIHYRMHPRNVGCIAAAGINCCCLANNHVGDWGLEGLRETLEVLDAAGVAHAGAGRNAAEAASPAILPIVGKGRVLVFAFGSTTSGIPEEWQATQDRPGVNLLTDLSETSARDVVNRVGQVRRAGDIVVVSIHWGGNWGYPIPQAQIDFAHRLVEGGVDIVHGHSSHHVKAIEVYQERLILYGCGDFLDDYEGIDERDEFRSDLALMYLVKVEPGTGRLREADLVPMQMRRFRLNHCSEPDAKWLCDLLNRQGGPFGTEARLAASNRMTLDWHRQSSFTSGSDPG